MKTEESQEETYSWKKIESLNYHKTPTTLFQKIIKNAINQCTHIILNTKKSYLKQIKPTAPMLNTLPSIHKEKYIYQTPNKLHITAIQTSQIHGPHNKNKHKIKKSHSQQKQYQTHT